MISYPFISHVSADNPYGDRAITDEMERMINQACYSTGVFLKASGGNDLQVIADAGMRVKVLPGACCIQGAVGIETAERSITLDSANASLPRIDRIVARLDLSDAVRSIDLYVKQGTPSNTPVAPDIITASNFYEIVLADVRVNKSITEITAANILDRRQDIALCGFVAPAFATNFDISEISSRYADLLESALTETVAGQLQSAISANAQQINTNQTSISTMQSEQLTATEYNNLKSRLGIS